ncbi:conserved hypothetical protein [Microcystis aeruginosa PCC 9432]|jgi:hypothetical protein|uniref:Uncharacterized protein n=5 Tax=Microcystis TaxID=1125 RepID=S3IX01_MICAE|nr:hypothetical protein [Microcystis aeruginosa]MCZ8129604.1 hypothetical protein [Microcystis sp. LE19-114.1B]NCR98723.1 hypothetical protein [Microcystis aeruginosa L311-01]OCY15647.1 MAG: hypothetical protein BEV12_14125 [Microcystis aeruginosa CACIAM 03]TRT98341.1 MAG: hypothetical protein EWV62_08795 [Microcystis aeruginosa Ma_OC_LR_19540900_S633]TRU12627.1 MAG: hypothetical protein EWV59_08280 [Microcystis aeruginosa Ma_MB_F_20061100_S19D]TRU19063.1 MAG: hypothetical protein EWV58_00305
MALSDREKQTVIDYLDSLDDALKAIILSSLEAFAEWLSNTLYSIYLKIKDGLRSLWQSIRNFFS